MNTAHSNPARADNRAVPQAIVSATALKRFTHEVFRCVGMSEAHADTVAEVLIWASLRGVDSHGVARIPRYVNLVRMGDLNVAPVMTLKQENCCIGASRR